MPRKGSLPDDNPSLIKRYNEMTRGDFPGWRWWAYVTAEAGTLFGLGLWFVVDSINSPNWPEWPESEAAYWGVGLMIGGIYRFYVGARDARQERNKASGNP